jgi:hypothetical protein
MSTPLTVADRIASAFVAAVVASLTAAAALVAMFVHGVWSTEVWSRVLLAATLFIAAAAALGFFLGPDRIANTFGVLWGTVAPSTWQAVLLLIGGLALLVWIFS